MRELSALALKVGADKLHLGATSDGLSIYKDVGYTEKIGRQSYEGVVTILQSLSGEWIRKQPATFFPLLEKVSEVGSVSPFLSKQWLETKQRTLSHSKMGHLL